MSFLTPKLKKEKKNKSNDLTNPLNMCIKFF